MGKGSRNRITRESEPNLTGNVQKKKARGYRKPMPAGLKKAIASVVCIAIVVAIVLSTLGSNGVFKRGNVLIRSHTGKFDINQQMATYLVWDTLFDVAAYQWQILGSSITSATGITSQLQYCLYYAQSGVQETLNTSINLYADLLKEYVAVCDWAYESGIEELKPLDKDAIKVARENAKAEIEFTAKYYTGYGISNFINLFIGGGVKLKDIQDVAEIQEYYKKVMAWKQKQIEDAITDKTLTDYRDNNPEDFYSSDYYTYTTDNEDLFERLRDATSVEEFKLILVEEAFNNSDKNYKSVYNQYATTLPDEAAELLKKIQNAIDGKEEEEEDEDEPAAAAEAAETDVEARLNKVLKDYDLTPQTYSKNAEDLPEEVHDWLFNSSRKKHNSKTFVTVDAYYVVVITGVPGDDEVEAAVWEKATEEGEIYGDGDTLDEHFKENVYKTLLVMLGFEEKEDGQKYYDETEDEVIQDILEALQSEMKKNVLEPKNAKFTESPEEDSFEEWLFKGANKDNNFKTDAKVGETLPKIKDDEEDDEDKNDSKGKNTVYILVESMKLDETPLVDGGYVGFTGKDHEKKAQEFLDSLKDIKDLTADKLKEAFGELDDAIVYDLLSEDSVDTEEVAAWLFDAERVLNREKLELSDLIAVAGSDDEEDEEDAEDTEDKDDEDEEEKDESASYVAFYLGSTPTWENEAKVGHINEQMEKWVKDLIGDETAPNYELTGMRWIKDKTPLATSENEESTEEDETDGE